MNQNEKEKEIYRSTFDKIHASCDLLGKVRSMNNQSKKKTFYKQKIAAAAVATALLLVSSNAIAYACSGATWVGKMVLSINGEEMEVDAKISTFDDGEISGKTIEIEIPESDNGSMEAIYEETEDVTQEVSASVLKEGDTVYLLVNDTKFDITEDLKDGKCEVPLEIGGENYIYTVEGDFESGYSIQIEK